MSVREGPPQPAPPHAEETPAPYPAEKARGGEIILRTRAQRVVFISGLVGAVLFALFVAYLAATR